MLIYSWTSKISDLTILKCTQKIKENFQIKFYIQIQYDWLPMLHPWVKYNNLVYIIYLTGHKGQLGLSWSNFILILINGLYRYSQKPQSEQYKLNMKIKRSCNSLTSHSQNTLSKWLQTMETHYFSASKLF